MARGNPIGTTIPNAILGLYGISFTPRAKGKPLQMTLGRPGILGPEKPQEAEKIFTSATPTPTLTVSTQASRPQVVSSLNNMLSVWARKRAMTNVGTQRTLGGS
jgi:hypothetical protein